MRLMTNRELAFVNGGDAAATRTPGQNSWGESPAAETPTWASVMGCIGGIDSECAKLAEKLLDAMKN